MELLFVTVIGAGLGALFRYILPRRDTYGALLLPALSGAVTAIVWVGLVWLGWTFDGTWIWVVSLGAGALAALLVALYLPRKRVAHDARRLVELSGGKA
jgi:O-antigen/teichoic acid export membrane protein